MNLNNDVAVFTNVWENDLSFSDGTMRYLLTVHKIRCRFVSVSVGKRAPGCSVKLDAGSNR